MAKVTIDLSELEIEMLLNCIETAIDVKHMDGEYKERAEQIKKELVKYLKKEGLDCYRRRCNQSAIIKKYWRVLENVERSSPVIE